MKAECLLAVVAWLPAVAGPGRLLSSGYSACQFFCPNSSHSSPRPHRIRKLCPDRCRQDSNVCSAPRGRPNKGKRLCMHGTDCQPLIAPCGDGKSCVNGQVSMTDNKPVLYDMPVSNNGARCRVIIYKKGIEDKVSIKSPMDLGGLRYPNSAVCA